jgi:hypothetical protein
MEDATILSGLSIALTIALSIITAINHKRIRSNCCGREAVASIDIENTTPNNK